MDTQNPFKWKIGQCFMLDEGQMHPIVFFFLSGLAKVRLDDV